MADTIRELVVKYGIEVDQAPLENLDSAITSLSAGLLGLGAIVLGAGATLFGLSKHAADAADDLEKMSQRVGVSMDDLQRLRIQSKLNEGEFEGFSQALGLLNRNMQAAAGGSQEAMKAFKAAGVPLAGIKNGSIDAGAAVEMIAKKLDKMPDGAKKSALAMQLFGRAGATLIPALKDIAEGMSDVQLSILELNKITPEQVEQGTKFNDSLLLLQQAVGGIVRSVGAGLVPAMREVVDGLIDFVVQNKAVIKTNLKGFIDGLTAGLRAAWKITRVLIDAFGGVANILGGVGSATKILLYLLTAISAGAILYGIGALATAMWALAGGIGGVNVAALLIPMLIGAAVLLVIAIVDDLVAFFQGRDSVTAVIIEKFKEVLAWFQEKFPAFSGFILAVFNVVSAIVTTYVRAWVAGFNMLLEAGKRIGAILTPIFQFLGDIISVVVDKISQVVGWYAGKWGSIFNAVAGGLNGLAGGINYIAGNTPSLTPAQSAGAAGGMGQMQVSNQTTINVPPGTDPTQVGPAVERGSEAALAQAMREAGRAGTSGVRQ